MPNGKLLLWKIMNPREITVTKDHESKICKEARWVVKANTRETWFFLVFQLFSNSTGIHSTLQISALVFWVHSLDDIPPCHHIRSTSLFFLGQPLPLVPFTILVITKVSGVSLLIVWPKDDACLFLKVIYHFIFSLAVSKKFILTLYIILYFL